MQADTGSHGSIVETMRAVMARDVFARSLGIEMEELRPGYCRTSVTLTAGMLNGYGVPHGGMLFTLADYAFAGACNSHGRVALAWNVSITFVGAAEVGARLTAEAVEDHLSWRTGLYRMSVTDESGRLIASCTGLAYRKTEMYGDLPDEDGHRGSSR